MPATETLSVKRRQQLFSIVNQYANEINHIAGVY